MFKMKIISSFNNINILSVFIFQSAVLDIKILGVNKRRFLSHDISRIQSFSSHSVLNKSNEITEKVNPRNIFRAHDIDNLNYTNNHGNPESVSYSYS